MRKRVVIHRYQMQIVESLWTRFAKMWISEAQRLRERLGKHQDLQVLENLTAPRQPLARWRARLVPAIQARKLRARIGIEAHRHAHVRREAEGIPPPAGSDVGSGLTVPARSSPRSGDPDQSRL